MTNSKDFCASTYQLIEQLKKGGRMVLPVRDSSDQKFVSVDKLSTGKLKINDLMFVTYIPLTDVDKQLSGK